MSVGAGMHERLCPCKLPILKVSKHFQHMTMIGGRRRQVDPHRDLRDP